MTGPMPFARGDRVKLTDRYANALEHSKKSKQIDWRTRRGIVTACNETQVTIMWPGRSSPDYVQIKGVEAVE